ncbi:MULTISPECIES: hypothetical protein [Microbacterium]|uniref:DUF3558 domain-containing protein n=1 Tax=Microbacterium wangchenii TaxID=2541726 RepID=A0ABX5SRX5_9MICO|nr:MULTISPECIES: hypothetical protein [Microbacterium]MCK6065477.1 hypothetical protein [Microbacterium sp. EYE_512]QBR88908.1 hypothetical protein E4K62_09535 [Microbacterium wangchenii]TFV82021.1 hypothetical protein E4V99_13875 [Microbacterium sp. dk485]
MRLILRSALFLPLCAAVALASGCATSPSATGGQEPAPPAEVVEGSGMVLDQGDGAELCLGPVAESFPPQCRGIPLDGWSWDEAVPENSSGDVRWGMYAVQGRYDGETLTVTTDATPLALYDPEPFPWPAGTGTAEEAELSRIGEEALGRYGDAFLSAGSRDGRLEVVVVWDDGTWQRQADAEYGDGVVVVTSALRPVREG